MAFQVRRVITGHDANGKAIAKIDEIVRTSEKAGPAPWRTRSGPPKASRRTTTARTTPARARSDHAAGRHHLPRHRVQARRAGAQPPHRLDRLRRRHVRRDRHGDGRHHGPHQGWRRAGAARHDPQLDQQRHGVLHHRRLLIDAKPVTAGGKVLERGGLSLASFVIPVLAGHHAVPCRRGCRVEPGMTLTALRHFASITIASASNSASGRASAVTPTVVLAGGCDVLTYLSRTSR